MDDETRDDEILEQGADAPTDASEDESAGGFTPSEGADADAHSDYKPVNRFDAAAVHHLSGMYQNWFLDRKR